MFKQFLLTLVIGIVHSKYAIEDTYNLILQLTIGMFKHFLLRLIISMFKQFLLSLIIGKSTAGMLFKEKIFFKYYFTVNYRYVQGFPLKLMIGIVQGGHAIHGF